MEGDLAMRNSVFVKYGFCFGKFAKPLAAWWLDKGW
jgi:hypothetical protein